MVLHILNGYVCFSNYVHGKPVTVLRRRFVPYTVCRILAQM